MRRVFIDLDGVLADFDGAFEPLFGCDHRTIGDDAMWRYINEHGSYFMDLPPMKGALQAFAMLRCAGHELAILTACPPSRYDDVAAQKKAWVREHIDGDVLVLPTAGGKAKPAFMQNTGDILVDDFAKNIRAWRLAGGTGVHHTGDWKKTFRELARHGVHV